MKNIHNTTRMQVGRRQAGRQADRQALAHGFENKRSNISTQVMPNIVASTPRGIVVAASARIVRRSTL